MKIIRLITSLVLLIMVSACTTATTYTTYPTTDKWATGGTLHESTIAKWRKASYSNRLATSADFVVNYFVNDLGINDFSDMDKRKQAATDLEECISTMALAGDFNKEKVTHIAAFCLTLMWPNKTDQNYSSNSNDTSWATVGTLRESTIAEWRIASYSNRLATSAFMAVASFSSDINDFSDVDKIKKAATDLEECISASSSHVDNKQVTYIAAHCLVSKVPEDAKDFVEITNFDYSYDSIGNVIFEGKVKNTSSTYDLQFVVLRATVYFFGRSYKH